MTWPVGENVVRREVWHGHPWTASTVVVVADQPDLLATYLPEGARFVFADGHPLCWRLKDDDLLDVRVAEGRFTAAEAEEIRAIGDRIGAALDANDRWWGDWTAWTPDPLWAAAVPPADWLEAVEI